jgi:hypothetical protein
MLVNNLTLLEMRTEIQDRAEVAAQKSGKKLTAGIKAMAQAVGVDYSTMKGFALGTIKRPSELTVDRVRAYLRDSEDPQVAHVAKGTALFVTDDDIAMLLDLLFKTAMDIKDDYQRFEDQTEDYAVSNSTYHALYLREGRLLQLRKKLEAQASCEFDFDTELQSVVPVRPK